MGGGEASEQGSGIGFRAGLAMGDEAEARQRLVHLLEYVTEIARPPTANRAAPTTLPSGEGVVVLHEMQLRKLSELQSSTSGQPTAWLSGDGRAGVWMKFSEWRS